LVLPEGSVIAPSKAPPPSTHNNIFRAGVTIFLSFAGSIAGFIGVIMPGIWFIGYSTDKLTG